MLLTEQARRTEIMLFAIPTGGKKSQIQSKLTQSKYLHEAERGKGAPKHPRHLNTSKKAFKNISPN